MAPWYQVLIEVYVLHTFKLTFIFCKDLNFTYIYIEFQLHLILDL